eukprot:883108-Rhodomonas_salina.3
MAAGAEDIKNELYWDGLAECYKRVCGGICLCTRYASPGTDAAHGTLSALSPLSAHATDGT